MIPTLTFTAALADCVVCGAPTQFRTAGDQRPVHIACFGALPALDNPGDTK